MPIYAYQCDDCQEPFQVLVRSMSAKTDVVCPKCGGEHVEKQVTAASALGIGSDGASLSMSSSACAPSG